MSDHLQPQVHPDADSLSAFVEGVLPEHERAQCLAHLAECSRCREIVFLTHDAAIAPAAPIPVSTPARRWFQPMPLLAAAAALCVILPVAWLYLHSRTGAPTRDSVARVIQPPSSAPVMPAETPAPKPVVPAAVPRSPRRSQPKPAAEKPFHATPVTVPDTVREVPPPTAAEPSANNSQTTTQPNVPPTPKPPAVVIQTDTAMAEASSGISGTVTDQSGAAVPQATVQLRQLGSNSTTNARTDHSGHFKFDGLAPGQYELQINSPGFHSTSQRVELQPQEVAAVKSELQVGSSATSVEVTAAAPNLDTSTAQLITSPRPLPSKLPAEITVTRGKVILSVDSAGKLFFSGNSGKSWKTVKSKWPGKVDDLVTPPEVPQAQKAVFQLTTDSGSIWLSRDGRRWYPASPQH